VIHRIVLVGGSDFLWNGESDMKGSSLKFLLSLGLVTVLASPTLPAVAASCEDLAHLALPKTTITLAQSVAAGAFTPPVPSWARSSMHPAPIPVAFCRVTGEIKPTQDSDIKFEVWLPLAGWTGRYESVGNGGFAGSIRYDSMRNPLLAGSAVASTDDGHDAPAIGPTSADWAFGHPEKIVDHGHRAVHLTAVTAKAITAAFYGRAPAHTYFVGCSKGGQEAFMEAQRYPDRRHRGRRSGKSVDRPVLQHDVDAEFKSCEQGELFVARGPDQNRRGDFRSLR